MQNKEPVFKPPPKTKTSINRILFWITLVALVASWIVMTTRYVPVNEYDGLVAEHNKLVNDYNELSADYNELIAHYDEYGQQVEEYKKQIEAYLQNLPKLLEGAIVPPYILIKERKVDITFRNLDGNVEYWEIPAESLEAQIRVGWAMRDVDISAMQYLGLNEIANRFDSDSKYVNLVGHGQYLDYKPYVIKENFEPIASKFYSGHPDDESRIREVWNMVTQLNTYSKEIKETPRLPLETLLLGGGDCEDLAILTASMLRAMSANWSVQLVYMDADNPTDPKVINHVTVYVDTGSYTTFVESTSNSEMSPWQLVNGFYFELQ